MVETRSQTDTAPDVRMLRHSRHRGTAESVGGLTPRVGKQPNQLLSLWPHVNWRTRRELAGFILGLACTLVFLVLAVHQVDWDRTVITLRSADLALAALGMALLIVTYFVFAVRWRVLLSCGAEARVVDTFSHIMIGYIANAVLPMRLGDVVRSTLLSRRLGVSGSMVLGTVALERLLDMGVVLALAFVLGLVIDLPPIVRSGIMVASGAVLIGLTGLAVLSNAGDRIFAHAACLWAFVPRMISGHVAGLMARFSSGLGVLRDGRQCGMVVALSALAWATAGTAVVVFTAAFHLPVPWYAGLFVLAVTNLGTAIPSSPGAIGVYHYLAILALSVWLPESSVALGYAIGTHGLTMLTNVAIGGMCLAREGIALRSLTTVPNAAPQPTLAATRDAAGEPMGVA